MRGRIMAMLITGVLVAAAAGCAASPSHVVSLWPKVDRERSVPKPPEPPRWPLTGEEAPSAEAVLRRVVSVKIENSPAARPQTNLSLADVVYESVAEGGITRFNALFHSKDPEVVGPVRSARLSDLYIVPQYRALFVFSGASASVNARVRSAISENLSQDAGVSYPYFRSKDRSAPHNLYAVLAKVREEARRRSMPQTMTVEGLLFDRRAVEATPTITEIFIPFSPANKVTWTYDAATRTYLRVNNGAKHMDKGTGKQIAARNVVVIRAKHIPTSRDVVGSTTYEIVLEGSGVCTVFRDGQRFEGTWTATKDAPPRFVGEDGKPILLAPGNTWIQVIQPSIDITMR
ncbi:MAG: DUF3048 domain-containing protein [Coriobacteriia bacterium]|nr:DUF3048 domain-containing protein [Coriobacteriia bacterium]